MYRWANGDEFHGHFENDLRHGEGKLIIKNANTIEGTWLNGIHNGEDEK